MDGHLNAWPIPFKDACPPQELQLVPGDRGALGRGSGLLQADVLTQLISVVIAGVAPMARAAFAGEQSNSDTAARGGEDAAASSGSQKLKEFVHSLLWGPPVAARQA